jgi:sarcosine oxidase subunit beta
MNPLPRGRGRWHQRLLYLGMVAAAAVPVVGVVGAGVVGCSVAYHLASAMPATKIVVMDPHAPAVAVAATSRSAGCVISASDAAEKCLLSVQTLADVSALQRLLDTDLGYRRSGCLRLATDSADLEVLRHQAEITTKAVGGGGAVVLDRGEAERKVPWLCCAEANVAGALWTEGDGVMDPTVLAGGYLQGARKLGAVEMLPAVAASVALRGDRAVGCRLSDGGTVACDHVVNAAGSWANLLTAGLGDLAGLPMAPTRSHYWLSQSMPSHFDGGDPIVIMPGARAYTRPEGPHGCLLGLQEEVSLSWDARQLPAPDAHPSLCAEMVGGDGEEAQDALLAQFDSLCHFFPSAAEVGWGHYTAGLSSYT